MLNFLAMPITTATDLVSALGQLGILKQAQLDELKAALMGRAPEPRVLAKELVRRGWVTPYQINQLLQGRGQELILGPYLVLDQLGEGGTGQVFKGRHLRIDRIVALKIIRPELLTDAEVVGRFS